MGISKDSIDPLRCHHLVALKPFEQNQMSSGLQLRFSIQRRIDKLDFSFTLSGDSPDHIKRVVVPALLEVEKRQRRDELWKSTCLEIFISDVRSDSYLELNLSPSGDWNLYAFDSYREGMRQVADVSCPKLDFETSIPGDTMTWKGSIESSLESGELGQFLSQQHDSLRSLVIGASAVLEYSDGTRGYWAISHAGGQPDFHMKESFLLPL